MATQKFGPLGPFSGKLGKVIGYVDKQGNQRLRTVGKYTFDNPSDSLKEIWLKTTIVAAVLRPVKDYIKMGFALQEKLTGIHYFNLAAAAARKVIEGNYPDLKIDFSKLKLSEGKMPAVENPKVIRVDDGLMFSWNGNQREEGIWPTDLVMIMAYLPDHSKAYFLRSAANRRQGNAFLSLPLTPSGQKLETYITFISEDHESTSNSIYTGQITLDQAVY